MSLDKNDFNTEGAKSGNLPITPICDVPPLTDWNKLFKEAKEKGYSPEEDANDFLDWDITITDGID